MSAVGVMHLVDTLEVGGAERLAVNLVNHLPRDRYRVHLCTTRSDGPLASTVAGDVARLRLDRAYRVDLGALQRLVHYVRQERIAILHAHSAALFAAVAAAHFAPYPAVVWHDHYGRDLASRTRWPYQVVARRIQGVIAVNTPLAEWAAALGVPVERIRYVPNFAALAAPNGQAPELPGSPGRRVVCVANWREQKDHPTLIRAFAQVRRAVPDAHLLLLGSESDAAYAARVREEIAAHGLGGQVTMLGRRDDVADVLAHCDVGVLSSRSEGLPLALLEYGAAGLAAVATTVGQCAEVLGNGDAGLLVPPGDPGALAGALVGVLQSTEERTRWAEALRHRVRTVYSTDRAVAEVCGVYQTVTAAS